MHVEKEEEEEKDEIVGIENNELLDFLYIYKLIVHAVLGC